MKISKRFIIIAILLLFVSSAFSTELKFSMEAKKYLRSANMYFGQKNYEKSLNLYKLIVEENAEFINLFDIVELSNYAYLIYDIDKDYFISYALSHQVIDKADIIFDQHKKLEEENPKEAGKFYKKEIKKINLEKIKENNEKIHSSCWSRIYRNAQETYKIEKYDTTLVTLNKLYEMAPDSILTLKMLARTYQSMENDEKAKEYFINISRLDPNDTTARLQLASMHFNDKNYEEAIRWYSDASEIEPENVNNYFNIGLCYNALKDHQKSYEMFKKVVELDPDNGDAFVYLSNKASKLDKEDESIEYLKKAIEFDPANIDFIQNITYRLNKLKRFKEAFVYAEMWKKLDPASKEAEQNVMFLKQKLK